jgi:hypothetical protein
MRLRTSLAEAAVLAAAAAGVVGIDSVTLA